MVAWCRSASVRVFEGHRQQRLAAQVLQALVDNAQRQTAKKLMVVGSMLAFDWDIDGGVASNTIMERHSQGGV